MFIPYIGITDFRTVDQVWAMLKVMDDNLGDKARRLMVGVMMSYRTLHGLPTRWTDAFPRNEEIAEIFTDHPRSYNALHFADYKSDVQIEDLRRAIDLCGQHLHAIQFDMIWPDVELLRTLKREYPTVDLILQIGTGALAKVDSDPVLVLQKLLSYGPGIIDVVLLDQSMGKGKRLQADLLMPFVQALFPHFHVAIGGGLGPTTMDLVGPFVRQFPGISWDAQGQLRPSGSALDPIDWSMAEEYIVRSIEMIF